MNRLWVWDVLLALIVGVEVAALRRDAVPPASKWFRRRFLLDRWYGKAGFGVALVWLFVHLVHNAKEKQ